jgi:hypothetical protein
MEKVMIRSLSKMGLALILVAAAGCQFMARSPDDYEKDTRSLLESKNADIKACYDEVLKQDKTAQGTVAVRFNVEPETGKIVNAAVDPAMTNAPEPIGQCVVNAINGLMLDPPDEREGQATFVYEFMVNPASVSTPAPVAQPPG